MASKSLQNLAPWNILRKMRHQQAATTFQRLLFSRHVADLRLIFLIASAAWILGFLVTLHTSVNLPQAASFVGGITLVTGTVMAWTYQTGNKRLGVVDLFASEISAICRVLAVVDVGRRLVATYDRTKEEAETGTHPSRFVDLSRFTTAENYAPVFDGNASDLQVLDAAVVNRTTEFYTYRKAMLDYMRRLAPEKPFATSDRREEDVWHLYMVQTIYMLFLSCESARLAINELIEYQPDQAESKINILLTELPTYAFLTRTFDDEDIRRKRLELRRSQYREIWRDIEARTREHAKDSSWARACTTASALKERVGVLFHGTHSR